MNNRGSGAIPFVLGLSVVTGIVTFYMGKTFDVHNQQLITQMNHVEGFYSSEIGAWNDYMNTAVVAQQETPAESPQSPTGGGDVNPTPKPSPTTGPSAPTRTRVRGVVDAPPVNEPIRRPPQTRLPNIDDDRTVDAAPKKVRQIETDKKSQAWGIRRVDTGMRSFSTDEGLHCGMTSFKPATARTHKTCFVERSPAGGDSNGCGCSYSDFRIEYSPRETCISTSGVFRSGRVEFMKTAEEQLVETRLELIGPSRSSAARTSIARQLCPTPMPSVGSVAIGCTASSPAQTVNTTTLTSTVSYVLPRNEARGYIRGILPGDTWRIQAFDSTNTVVSTRTIMGGSRGTGSHISTPWSIPRFATPVIMRVVVSLQSAASFLNPISTVQSDQSTDCGRSLPPPPPAPPVDPEY